MVTGKMDAAGLLKGVEPIPAFGALRPAHRDTLQGGDGILKEDAICHLTCNRANRAELGIQAG